MTEPINQITLIAVASLRFAPSPFLPIHSERRKPRSRRSGEELKEVAAARRHQAPTVQPPLPRNKHPLAQKNNNSKQLHRNSKRSAIAQPQPVPTQRGKKKNNSFLFPGKASRAKRKAKPTAPDPSAKQVRGVPQLLRKAFRKKTAKRKAKKKASFFQPQSKPDEAEKKKPSRSHPVSKRRYDRTTPNEKIFLYILKCPAPYVICIKCNTMPYEHDTGKTRISALIKEDLRDKINFIAGAEDRQFSPMVCILLAEAVESRKQAKNKK